MIHHLKIIGIVLVITWGLGQSNDTHHEQVWLANVDIALENAQESGKLVFVYFSGSDWCRNCMMLDKNVISTDEFNVYADQNLILVNFDFPSRKKNKLSKEQKTLNEKMAEKYNPDGVFPFVLLLDPDGKTITSISGYSNQTPTQFTTLLKKK